MEQFNKERLVGVFILGVPFWMEILLFDKDFPIIIIFLMSSVFSAYLACFIEIAAYMYNSSKSSDEGL
jgi:hypothetical protein